MCLTVRTSPTPTVQRAERAQGAGLSPSRHFHSTFYAIKLERRLPMFVLGPPHQDSE